MSLLDVHARDLAGLAARDRRRSLAPRRGKDFASNDYLGLAGSPRLAAAARDAIDRGIPAGSGGSRLLRGNHPEHEALESEAAAFFGSEAALFLPCGYSANVAALATLPQRGDRVFHDALVHASMHDGLRLSRADARPVAHNDAGAFDAAIREWRRAGGTGRAWIAVESLYSMDGDRAPIADLAAVAATHDAFLLIDEAHATGVFGDAGRGLSAGLHGGAGGGEGIVTLHTCGKAMGAEGALLCLPAVLRDFLVNRARPFIFSTAPSPLMAAIVREALRCLSDEPELRARLHALLDHAAVCLARVGATPTGTQILPLVVGEDGPTMRLAAAVQAAGFDVRGIRPPTVPEGTARLRIPLTLNVDEADVDALADAIMMAGQ